MSTHEGSHAWSLQIGKRLTHNGSHGERHDEFVLVGRI